MIKWGKILLAVLLFFCLFNMPYGYYQFVRFFAIIGFSIFAYQANASNKKAEIVIFISLVMLFQPIFKISLGQEIWTVVDVVVGSLLIVSALIDFSKEKSNR